MKSVIAFDEYMGYGCSFLSKEQEKFFLKLQLEQARGEYCALGSIFGIYSKFRIIQLEDKLKKLEMVGGQK